MSSGPIINLASEGLTDAAVGKRLILLHGGALGWDRPAHGKQRLDSLIPKYRQASAHGSPWLILRDLDHESRCPSILISRLNVPPHDRFCLRIAMRSVESWLLADRTGMAEFLRVPISKVTERPELLDNPKRYVIDLARQSRSRAVRAALVPEDGAGQGQGPEYATSLTDFATRRWRVEDAIAGGLSPSLTRGAVRLGEMIERAAAA